MTNNISAAQLRKAASLKEQIESLEQELNDILGASNSTTAVAQAPKGNLSAAGLARIKAAQKARWAGIKANKAPSQAPAKKKTMSAAAKAKISAAAKARWAKIKAGR